MYVYKAKAKDKFVESGIIQEIFLNHLRKRKISVDCTMGDASVVTGIIQGFDFESIILNNDGSHRLLYKRGILSITPHVPVNFVFNREEGNPKNKNL